MRALIYRPSKTAMQSGRRNTRQWVLEYEPAARRQNDPLMGWAGSADTLAQVKLKFASKDDAIAYAERKGLEYHVKAEQARTPILKAYADNFR